MRFGNESSFPHPVLCNFNDDYASGEFSLNLNCAFNIRSNIVTINFSVHISENTILDLISEGKATVGIFVKCAATHFSSLISLPVDGDKHSFPQGSLSDFVEVTPLVWYVAAENQMLKPAGLHSEFGGEFQVSERMILALEETERFFVEPAGMPTEETIFRFQDLRVDQRKIEIILSDDDRISIGLSSDLYKEINDISLQGNKKTILMNSIYLSAVMDVLSQLMRSAESYEDKTWYEIFRQRCQAVGVDLGNLPDQNNLIESAQKVLNFPICDLYSKVIDNE